MVKAAEAKVGDWLAFSDGRVALRVGKVELGQGVLQALALIAAEELDVAPGRIDVISGDTALTPDDHPTVGSMSVSMTGPMVRRAAASARALFLAALPADLRGAVEIEDGEFRVDGLARGLSYWTLAPRVGLDAAVDQAAPVKAPGDYRIVGRFHGRELTRQVSGGAFIHDVDLPGMLHARMVRPPHLLAELAETLAVAMPAEAKLVQDRAFLGVIAPREEEAVRLAARLERAAVWRDRETPDPDPFGAIVGANVAGEAPAPEGSAGQRVDVAVSRRFLSHASVGLCCAVALWEGRGLTVWTHSQGVVLLRQALAELLAVPGEQIRVIHAPGAGCYGHNGADDVAADAALMAREVPGRPVRVQWTRAQELACAPFGAAMRTRVAATLGDDGRIAAFHADVVSAGHVSRPGIAGAGLLAGYLKGAQLPLTPFDPPVEFGGAAGRNVIPGYDIAQVSHQKTIVQPKGMRTSALRSLGAHVNVCAIEAAMDEAAALAGEDPVAFRLRHLSDPRARAVVEQAAAMSGWPRAEPCGVGYARYENSAGYCAVVVQVAAEDDLKVERVWCAVDAGCAIDLDGVANQVEGGAIQAISWTLKEAAPMVAGQAAAGGWDDYPILKFSEAPRVEVTVIHRPEEPSLGVGEASCGPAAAALANAVARALGVRISQFPITRERILEALA